jgi:hypothetical protein
LLYPQLSMRSMVRWSAYSEKHVAEEVFECQPSPREDAPPSATIARVI